MSTEPKIVVGSAGFDFTMITGLLCRLSCGNLIYWQHMYLLNVILSWIFTNDKRQRIFNRAGNTIVIKLKENSGTAPDNISYMKE